MDPTTSFLLGAGLPPLAVGLTLLVLARSPWRAGAGGLASVVAVLATTGAVLGWPSMPPVEASDWLPVVALVASGLTWLESRRPLPWWASLTARLVLSAGALRALLDATLTYTWSPVEGWVWLTGLTVLAGGLWFALPRLAGDVDSRATSGFAALWLACVALVLAGTGSLKLGQLAGGLGSGLGLLALVTLGWREGWSARALVDVIVPPAALLLLAGVFFSETPKGLGLLLLLAPTLLPLAGRDGDSLFPWRAVALALGVMLVAGGWVASVQEAEPEFVPGQY